MTSLSFLASCAILCPLLYILNTKWKRYKITREVLRREWQRQNEVNHDRAVCNVLETLPLSEASND